MDIEAYINYCLEKKGVTEELPFGEKTLVYKVSGKMFTLADIDTFEGINLKCKPEIAIQLREGVYRGCPWLSHEQEALEYSTNRWKHS